MHFVWFYSPKVSGRQQVCQGLYSDESPMGTVSSLCVLDICTHGRIKRV